MASKEYHQKWREANREKCRASQRKHRESGRKMAKKYGLTVDELQEIRSRDCELCGKPGTHIDHCHETGKVRGHLCSGCNTGLGQLGDNVEGLQKALDYLTRDA